MIINTIKIQIRMPKWPYSDRRILRMVLKVALGKLDAGNHFFSIAASSLAGSSCKFLDSRLSIRSNIFSVTFVPMLDIDISLLMFG